VADRYSLRRVSLEDIGRHYRPADDPACEITVRRIMEEVRLAGEPALARLADELDGNSGRLWYGPDDFSAALESLAIGERDALERVADRIRAFAQAQLASLSSVDIAVPGGRAGHTIHPVERAGCYVPGGRYPLPSTVLMTALVAKTAGVADVAVACPRPSTIILAACALAEADTLLAAGGAQAIAAFAYGVGSLSSRDVIVGPGNRYVAAAKRLAQAIVRTDAPAGPSELLIVADASTDPVALAWDLIAQAEHDPDAVPAIAVSDESMLMAVEKALGVCLEELREYRAESADIAVAALGNGWAFVSSERAELAAAANRFAPEHLELALVDPSGFAALCQHAGALFLGNTSAEAFGDYGVGPNHTLPTSGRARSSGGLSVFDFLRIRTWLKLDSPDEHLVHDTAILARSEGLEAHARSAEQRLGLAESP
jgi:phosphoribosyl-ATP pyrophosphohydrolase/phosphoribosyl-AMP cyclohydrolase/histidinol dehydrogenase